MRPAATHVFAGETLAAEQGAWDLDYHRASPAFQFGYVFLGTGLLAHKGWAATVPSPMVSAVLGCVQVGLARMAVRRGWVG